jgi:hypothetical protein
VPNSGELRKLHKSLSEKPFAADRCVPNAGKLRNLHRSLPGKPLAVDLVLSKLLGTPEYKTYLRTCQDKQQ